MATIKQEYKKQNKGSHETSRTTDNSDNTQRIIKIKQEKQIKSEMIAFYASIASTTDVNEQQVKQSTKDVNTQQVKQSTTDVNTQQVKQSTTGINKQQVKQPTTDLNTQVQQTNELHHQFSTYQPLTDDPFSDVIFMGITRAERKPSFPFKFSVKDEKTDFFTTQENPIVIDDDNILLTPYNNASSTCTNNNYSTDPYSDDVIFMGMEMTDRKPIFPFNCTIKTESKDFFNNIIIIDDDEEEQIIVTNDNTNQFGENKDDDNIYTDQRQRKRKPLEAITSDRNTESNSLGRNTTSNSEPPSVSRIVKIVSTTMTTEKSSSATNNLMASSDESDVPTAKENQTSQATKENQSSKKTKGKKRKKRRKSPSQKENSQNDQVTTRGKNDDKHQTAERKETVKTKESKCPQDDKNNGDERSKVKLINQTTQTINAGGNERSKQLRRIVRIYKNGRELYLKYVHNWHYNKEFVLVYIKDKEYIRLFSKEYELHNFLQAFYDLTVAPNCYPPGWIIKLMCYYMWKIIHGVNDQQRFMKRVKFLPRIVQYRDYFMCKAVDNAYQNAWMILQNLTNPDNFSIYISSDQNYDYLDKIFYKHTDSGINVYRKFFLDMEKRFYAEFLKETSLL